MAVTTLYKTGQGYWTRMLSAVGGALILAAAAHWVWSQLSLLQWEGRIYVQAAAAAAILIAGGALLYYLIGLRPRTTDFLIATEGEMKKVAWPTRREVTGSTWVVVAFLFLMVGLLFASDYVFATAFQLAGVLDVNPEALPALDAATP